SVFKGDGKGGFTSFPGSPFKLTNTANIAEKGPVAMITGNFRKATLNSNVTTNAPEADLAIVNQSSNNVAILLGSVDSNDNIVITPFTGGRVPDIAVTNKGQATLGIYVGLGSATFSNRIEIGTPASPGAIVSGIFTSSGLPDVALTAQGSTANQGVVTIIQDSSSFSSGTGNGNGVAQTPYPASEYVDLGEI